MIIKTHSKIDCIRAFINTWIKDPRKYCDECGTPYVPGLVCCESPQILDNFQLICLIKRQNEMRRHTRANVYASTKDKTIRWGLSIPKNLLKALEKYFFEHYQEKLFEDKDEINRFMRAFPIFCIAERV